MATYIIMGYNFTDNLNIQGSNMSLYYFKGIKNGVPQWGGISVVKRYKTMRWAEKAIECIYNSTPLNGLSNIDCLLMNNIEYGKELVKESEFKREHIPQNIDIIEWV